MPVTRNLTDASECYGCCGGTAEYLYSTSCGFCSSVTPAFVRLSVAGVNTYGCVECLAVPDCVDSGQYNYPEWVSQPSPSPNGSWILPNVEGCVWKKTVSASGSLETYLFACGDEFGTIPFYEVYELTLRATMFGGDWFVSIWYEACEWVGMPPPCSSIPFYAFLGQAAIDTDNCFNSVSVPRNAGTDGCCLAPSFGWAYSHHGGSATVEGISRGIINR